MGEFRRVAALLVLALAVLVGPPAGAEGGESSFEVHYARGERAFAQGDYHEALREFRQALRLEPHDARVLYRAGVTELQLHRHAAALDSLERAGALDPDLPSLDFHLGVACYHRRRYEEAEARLRHALEEEPDHARARFFLGLVHWRLERPEEAIRELEQARAMDPSLEQETSLFLGRIYMETGDTSKAVEYLAEAGRARDPRVAFLSRDLSRRIQVEVISPAKRWDLYGFATVGYDSNVVLNPQDSSVDFPISDQDDFRLEFFGRARYFALTGNRHNIALGYSLYQTLYQDLSDFNLQGHLPEFLYWWEGRQWRFWTLLGLDYYYLDNEDYLRRWHGTASVAWTTPNQSGRVRLFYRYRNDTYFDAPDSDGNEDYVGAELYLFPWANKNRYLQLGAGYGDRESTPNFDYKTRAAEATFLSPVGEHWYLFAGAWFTNYDYDEINTFFEARRDDTVWEIAGRATYQLGSYTNLLLEYRYTDHSSSIPFYDFDRQIISVGIEARY